jgi:hypothetical protein
VGEPEGKRPSGRLIPKCEDNLIGLGVMDWIDLSPVVGCCEHGNEPRGFHKIMVSNSGSDLNSVKL